MNIKGCDLTDNSQSWFLIIHMKKFNTFAANSPVFSDYYGPKIGTPTLFAQNSHITRQDYFKNSGIDQPKSSANFDKDTFQHLPSAQKKESESNSSLQEESVNRNPYESRISLLMSQVSIPPAPRPEVNIHRLFNIENNITQQILQLREQKITLMQELSKVLDTKNLYEHYLLKNEREKDERETEFGSNINENIEYDRSPKSYKSSRAAASAQPKDQFVPLHISAPILKKNEELHLRLKEIQIKQEIFGPAFQQAAQQSQKNKEILEQILQIRQLNSNLKNEISQRLKNTHQSPNQQSRFVTFLPQDRQKHFESKSSNGNGEYQELQEKYNRLVALNKEIHFRMTPEQIQYLEALKRQNRELLQQAEDMVKNRNNSSVINELIIRKNENDREKQNFVQEFQRFRQVLSKVKQENDRLRYELGL